MRPPTRADHTAYAVVVREQRKRRGLVVDGDARLCRSLVERCDEARPAAPGLDREAAPEAEAAVLPLECLAAVARLIPHALATQPDERVVAAGHELLHEVGIGAVLGEPRHVVVVVGLGVGAEVGLGQLAFGEIGHQRAERIKTVEDHPHGACGIGAVAAALVFRCGLQQAHSGTGLRRGERCCECGVAAAHDHDIGLERVGHSARLVMSCVAVAAGSA